MILDRLLGPSGVFCTPSLRSRWVPASQSGPGFTGTQMERKRGALGAGVEDENGFQAKHFFWAFATAETVLRYYALLR